jgi:hypothetical protein
MKHSTFHKLMRTKPVTCSEGTELSIGERMGDIGQRIQGIASEKPEGLKPMVVEPILATPCCPPGVGAMMIPPRWGVNPEFIIKVPEQILKILNFHGFKV